MGGRAGNLSLELGGMEAEMNKQKRERLPVSEHGKSCGRYGW